MTETKSEQLIAAHQEPWLSRFNLSVKKSWKNFFIPITEWPIKRPFKFITLCLLMVFVFISLINIMLIDIFLNYSVPVATVGLLLSTFSTIKDIFSTDGRFDWYALSAFIAGLTYLTNSAFNRKKFRADLISKSRIEWLQIVRDTMAEYLTKARTYLFIYKEYFIEGRPEDDEINLIRLNKYGEDLDLLKNKLHLYISNNKGNQELNTKIEYVATYLNSLPKPARNTQSPLGNERLKFTDTPIVDLLNYSREYIKNEWERAKRGK